MTKQTLSLILFVFFLKPHLAWSKSSAHLKPEATVKGAAIKLGEVAKIDGSGPEAAKLANIEIGAAPLPGSSRSVGADAIRIQLKQQNLDPALLVKEPTLICRVTRSFQTLPGDRLLEAAREFLQGQIVDGVGKTAIEPVTRPRDLQLPVGKVELVVEPVGSYSGASRQVMVQVNVDGVNCNRMPLSLRLRQYVKVAIAKTSFKRGDALNAGMIGYEERDRMSLPEDVLVEGDSLEGLEAVQMISAGMPISRRAAAAPAVIKRGDEVTLQARMGGIVVSTPGVASEDGRIGSWVRVRNPQSGQETRAQVIDSKTVEVKL